MAHSAIESHLLPSAPTENTTLFHYRPGQLNHGFQLVAIKKAPKVYTFLIEALLEALLGLADKGAHANCVAFKLLIPTVDGYISRNDVIAMRLTGSVLVEDARDFCEPLQHIQSGVNDIRLVDIFTRCSRAVGGVRLRSHNSKDVQNHLVELNAAFVDRLSFTWISVTPLTVKRLAFIQGRSDTESSIEMWQAARALGIALVIFDAEGYWL